MSYSSINNRTHNEKMLDEAKKRASKAAKLCSKPPPKCRKGQILRNAYIRNEGKENEILICESCIHDRGAKGKQRGYYLKPTGSLSVHGYHAFDDKQKRHEALTRATRYRSKAYKKSLWDAAVSVSRRLIAQANYRHRTTIPDEIKRKKIYEKDAKWIKKYYKK